MSSKEATQVGIPTWDSANVPEGGRSMLTISATIFVGQNKGTHPELVKYFMYMARGVTGVPAGEEVVTLATRLAAAEAALFIIGESGDHHADKLKGIDLQSNSSSLFVVNN
eukprot:gene2910-29370_t